MKKELSLCLILFMMATATFAQTTAFNFQGRMNDGSDPANGRYDFQFKLFDAIAGGNQVGPAITRANLLLINGVFSTSLDFGSTPFTSGDRFLEISVRPNGSPNAYVVLGSRQQIMSVPLAVRSVNATQADSATYATNATNAMNADLLGNVTAAQYARLNHLNTSDFRTSGNVGFGTVAPNTRLTLSGGSAWTASQWTASMNLQNASTLGWEPNASSQRFGIGQSDGGLYFFRTYAAPGQTIPPANVDMRITDNGDIAQPADRSGAPKAMVYVVLNNDSVPTILRCYNGVSGLSSNQCGFVAVINSGPIKITFPFQINDRFAVATSGKSGAAPTIASIRYLNSTEMWVQIYFLDGSSANNVDFTLVVY